MALGAVLLMSSACSLTALDLSLDVTFNNNQIVIDGRVADLSEKELFQAMSSGATMRLTWVFRLDGVEEKVVRYARRDPLSEGFLVYGTERYDSVSPVPPDRLGRVLSTLDGHTLSLGPWKKGAVLEARFFLDSDLLYPPMSLTSLFRDRRVRSAWRVVSLSDTVRQ